MSCLGKQVRMRRIFDNKTGKTVIIPMDHCVTLGPIPGLTNMEITVKKVIEGGVNAILVHKGLVRKVGCQLENNVGLIVHMSASTNMSSYPNFKILVCSVEEAVKMGADAISIHINLGNSMETKMLNDFSKVANEAYNYGMPLLAMIYPRGENINNELGLNEVKHCARIAAEIGADIVKISYTGNSETFKEIVDSCGIPVVIAGGNKINSEMFFLKMIKDAIEAGAAGVSIGRNIFQHEKIANILKSVSMLVHSKGSLQDALVVLAGK